MKSKAFTLIELMVVVLIMIMLIALLAPKYFGVDARSKRAACARNVKNLVQAINVYTSSTMGIWKHTTSSSLNIIFGSLYQSGEWNDLKNLVCPANKDKLPPTPEGYGNALTIGSTQTIDYWVVFGGNTYGSNLDVVSSFPSNILLIESFNTTTNQWASSRHGIGGLVGRINGSAEYLTTIPANKKNSTSVTITASNCAYSIT